MNEIKEYTEKMLDDIKHIDEFGNEYWLARELQSVLQYTEWRKFKGVIEDYEVVYWDADIGEHKQVNSLSMIQLGTREVLEIVGVPF